MLPPLNFRDLPALLLQPPELLLRPLPLLHLRRRPLIGIDRAGEVFFKDRYDQTYMESGVADQTGLLYAARLGVKYDERL